VTSVRWRPFRVPLARPFAAAHGLLEAREGFVLELEASDGSRGLGEASPLPSYAPGTLCETGTLLESLARQVVGRNVVEAWHEGLPHAAGPAGAVGAALCAVETALADLITRRDRVPLARLLHRPVTPGEAPLGLYVNAIISATAPAGAAAEAREWTARGFRVLKAKVGTGLESDVARVRAVREAAPEATIRVDANGAWGTGEALPALHALAPFDIEFCEQPLPAETPVAAFAELVRCSPVAIALDESCRSVADLEAILQHRAAHLVVVKPMVTGFAEGAEMRRLAYIEEMPVVVTTLFDAGLGTAAAMHLAAAFPSPKYAHGLATLDFLEDDLVTKMWPALGGRLTVPRRPGIGVEIEDQALERYATGPWRGATP
jgi:o-succinylbenzoate synthase